MTPADQRACGPARSALGQLRAVATTHAEAIRLACLWEATAEKVGNVHPSASFADCDFGDFCAAAAAIAPVLAGERAGGSAAAAVGDRVLAAVAATQRLTRANVNLGIVLLIAPLAFAKSRADVSEVLAGLTAEDGAKVYRAIAMAKPGGMQSGNVPQQWDVTGGSAQDIDLIAAMRSASDRDRIARQYAGDFSDFFEHIVPVVQAELAAAEDIGEAIVRAQLRLLAAASDSLIERKCGAAVAREASRRAAACFADDGSWDLSQRLALDRWLREDANRRNPGTTADLIAAAIYWLIR